MKNFLRNKRILQKRDNISIFDIEKLPYYEYIEYVLAMEEDLKREQKQNKEQKKRMDSMKFNQPKIPKMKVPKF